jgi:hypothetical protein
LQTYLYIFVITSKIKNFQEQTPLQVAFNEEEENIVKYLFENGEDINQKLPGSGETLLHDAQEEANLCNAVIFGLNQGKTMEEMGVLGFRSQEEAISKFSNMLPFYENIIQYLKDHGAIE